MKKLPLLLAFLVAAPAPAPACTTFAFPGSAEKIIAKSFEWDLSMGLAVHNKRNVEKTAILFTGGDPLRWKSRFSSLTLSQHGREFPLSGMNEKGLVVEVMILASSEHPRNGVEPAANELQWIQYILDTAADVGDAIRQARAARVIPLQQKVHYLVCDAAAACASFEYLGGRLEIHSGSSMPVPSLTNNSYAESAAYIRRFQGFGGSQPAPRGSDSLSRFVIASTAARNFKPGGAGAVSYAFATLQGLSPRTQWSLVWEPNAQRLHFRSAGASAIKTIDISRLEGSCGAPVKLLDIEAPGLSGDVTARMSDYSIPAARAILKKNTSFEAQLREVALEYPGAATFCRE